eukprot:TRINITY_DN55395_c0_g1_i1.p1 TRINITY_DN55395_c0_g1~~TRINITY_DN55395_c0_g1_i1.p1  ORF type:complete len:103 (-),score=26.80 TRINITY_DN55395_c0_g1_i1:20-328(-)
MLGLKAAKFVKEFNTLQEGGASMETLFELWRTNGLPKNHYTSVVNLTPVGLPDYWSINQPESRGSKYTAENIGEYLLESEEENKDAYLALMISTNFGSCVYD